LKFDNFTLDIDSSIITRYGEQEGAAKGYNPRKPGRKSQHPILAFVADIETVIEPAVSEPVELSKYGCKFLVTFGRCPYSQ
jgi:hypothetical protein